MSQASSQDLAPRFDPPAVEPALYRRWLERGYFHVSASEVLDEGKDPYVIVIPPPNVTAVLHMGHGLNNTIQDVLIRFQRMRGRAAEWLPGTDHAGIATQNVVERQLQAEGKTRFDLGREPFETRIWDFVEETGGTILDQLKAIGCSADWERTAFTLDEGLNRAVREVFVRLYEKDLIYRGEYIINWCPRCGTALSNEEAEGAESAGRMWHLRYPIAESAWGAAEAARKGGAEALGQFGSGGWYLTVSTTRPETMLGDTGVAVNPEDDRYQPLIGADLHLPLTDRTIPVFADGYVDPEFGTGMVKVTPAHDVNDFEMAKRADLEIRNVMNADATMSDEVPEAFRGMDRFDARKAVLRALEAEGMLAGEQEHIHRVPRCYRCDTVVEPRLSEQWFVRMAPLAKPALKASRSGELTFTPARWQKTYDHWLENIRDWCISRQLWWGHRIPVWYCHACDAMHVLREDPEVCPDCGSGELRQDPDVLDTWFSSQLWPFSPFGWPEETDDFKAFYPGHTMVTAPEIIFFWVARMVMIGLEFHGELPFREVFLHGTVRDAQGRKMSKSLGNGIDPLEVVEEFGADAMRYTLISACAIGTDIQLDHEDVEASFANGRNFSNKIWNVGRFTLMSVGDAPVKSMAEVEPDLERADRWILHRLDQTIREVTDGMERFRLHDVAERLYHFFWGDLADWYLEIVKPRLKDGPRDRSEDGPQEAAQRDANGEEPARTASREAARSTLITVLDEVLRLLHPIIPFVTTELWDRLPVPTGAERPADLIIADWPAPRPARQNTAAAAGLTLFQELVTQIRSLRKEYGVGEGAPVTLYVEPGQGSKIAGAREAIIELRAPLERLARVETLHWGPPPEGTIGAGAVLIDGTEVTLPLEGLIDLERESDRTRDEMTRLEGLRTGAQRKLDNENFTDRAPEEVVQKERDKLVSVEEQMARLAERLKKFGGGA